MALTIKHLSLMTLILLASALGFSANQNCSILLSKAASTTSPTFPIFEVNRKDHLSLDWIVGTAKNLDVSWRSSPNSNRLIEFRLETELKRDDAMRKAYEFLVQEFRKDPQLNSFSDRDILRAAFRVLRWRIEISGHAGMYSPGFDSMVAFQIEKYRLYLKKSGVDPDLQSASFTEMFNQFGIQSLYHGTTVKALVEILTKGKLTSQKNGGQTAQYSQGNPGYVYLEALSSEMSGQAPLPIYIELKSSVLDEYKWSHFNFYWKYGEKDKRHSLNPSNMIAAFLNLIKSVNQKSGTVYLARNEFLFTEDIELQSNVKAIYVIKEKKAELVAELKAAGVSPDFISLIIAR